MIRIESVIIHTTSERTFEIEHDSDVLTDLGPEFRLETDDLLIDTGADEGSNRFTELLV